MGYDTHFLERLLTRAEEAEAELAMSLYKDSALLSYLLAKMELAPGVERVAIALSAGESPCHLIVTREGGFVTCLGRGMSTGGHPILSWRRLRDLSGDIVRLQERLARADRHLQEAHQGEVGKLIDRLFTSGPYLSREDYHGLATLRMLHPWLFVRTAAGLGGQLYDLRDHLKQRAERRQLARGQSSPELVRFWQTYWGSTHAQMLVADGPSDEIERSMGQLDELMGGKSAWAEYMRMHAWSAVRFGHPRAILLAGWTSARLGRHALGPLRETWRGELTYSRTLTASLGLCAIGMRHNKLRAECARLLHQKPNILHPDTARGEEVREIFRDTLDKVDGDPRAMEGFVATLGREMMKTGWSFSPEERERFKLDSDPSPELLRVAATYTPFGSMEVPALVMLLSMTLYWAVFVRGEELFFERSFADTVRHDVAQNALELLEHHLVQGQGLKVFKERRAVPRVQKGAPCPCGSGKPYGRCCRR